VQGFTGKSALSLTGIGHRDVVAPAKALKVMPETFTQP
jgi:hypothetical protein